MTNSHVWFMIWYCYVDNNISLNSMSCEQQVESFNSKHLEIFICSEFCMQKIIPLKFRQELFPLQFKSDIMVTEMHIPSINLCKRNICEWTKLSVIGRKRVNLSTTVEDSMYNVQCYSHNFTFFFHFCKFFFLLSIIWMWLSLNWSWWKLNSVESRVGKKLPLK